MHLNLYKVMNHINICSMFKATRQRIKMKPADKCRYHHNINISCSSVGSSSWRLVQNCPDTLWDPRSSEPGTGLFPWLSPPAGRSSCLSFSQIIQELIFSPPSKIQSKLFWATLWVPGVCPTWCWMIRHHFLSSFSILGGTSARAEYSYSQSMLQPPMTGLVWM